MHLTSKKDAADLDAVLKLAIDRRDTFVNIDDVSSDLNIEKIKVEQYFHDIEESFREFPDGLRVQLNEKSQLSLSGNLTHIRTFLDKGGFSEMYRTKYKP